MFGQADLVVIEDKNENNLIISKNKDMNIVTVDDLKQGKYSIRVGQTKMISIIILTFNQLEDTKRCYESLLKNPPEDYEVIFVDNGSKDGTAEYLKKVKAGNGRLKLIFNEINLGFSKANNQAMKIADGEYVLLLNNDVVLTEGWIQRLVACAESDAEIGVAGPCTNNAVGQQVVGTGTKLDEQEIQRFAAVQLISNAGCWIDVHRIIGFCMLIKREVIAKIGMLDERFGPGGFEDYDFCLRVMQAGYKIMIASDVFVYHIGGKGYTKNNLDYNKLRAQNVQIFIDKWCKKALEIMETF